MNVYVYRWSIKPESGLTLDLRTTAPSVLVAQREVQQFLVDHDGSSWIIEYVTRETVEAHRPPIVISRTETAPN